MKKSTLIYIIYLFFIITMTAYFSIKIFHGDMRITPIVGKFISPIKGNIVSSTYVVDEIRFVQELELYASLSIERRKISISDYRNSEGFKDYEHSIEKPNNTFRIIALGDSFTEGAYISMNDTWPKQLEKKLNRLNISKQFEVFNLGVNGADTLEEVKIFEENGLKYNPDMVILLFYPNDWEDALQTKKRANELWDMYKNGSFKFPVGVEEKIKELNASEEVISRLVFQVAISEFWDYANQRGLENIWKENVESPLKELIDVCKERKIELVVAGIDLTESTSKNQQELLNNFLPKYEISFLNLTSYFPLKKDELRILDMHLSEKGYDLLSTKILEFLIQTNKIRIGR